MSDVELGEKFISIPLRLTKDGAPSRESERLSPGSASWQVEVKLLDEKLSTSLSRVVYSIVGILLNIVIVS